MTLAGFGTGDTITVTVGGVVIFLALILLARVALRKSEPRWKRVRVGVFVEREVIPPEELEPESADPREASTKEWKVD